MRTSHGQRLALKTLVEACVCVASMAWGLSYFDLSHLAGRPSRGGGLEPALDDPVSMGKADFVWLLSLPRAGLADRKLAAAERVAGPLEPYAVDREGRSVLGMLTLSAALAAAAIQRSDTAADWLKEAEAIARQNLQ